MKRREFIGLIGGAAAAWPAVGRAQQSGRIRRIGVLFALPESDRTAQSRLAAFRGELQKLGWADITMDTRYVASNDAEARQRYAKELVALQPDLLLSQTTDTTKALLQQTRTIPIIFTIVADPVGEGFVASFPRPGGNVTGFIIGEPSMGGKWLELLKEIAPNVTRVLVPFNTATSVAEYYMGSLRATAALLGIDASAAFIRDMSELEAVVAAHARTPLGGLVMIPVRGSDFIPHPHPANIEVASAPRSMLANAVLIALNKKGFAITKVGQAASCRLLAAQRRERGVKVGQLLPQVPQGSSKPKHCLAVGICRAGA